MKLIGQVLLILLSLLRLSTQVFHGDVESYGCSESDSDKQFMLGVDGDVVYYADFVKKQVVLTLPDFGDPMTCSGCYEGAVSKQGVCKSSLQALQKAMKDVPLPLDPPGAPLLYLRDHLKPSENNTLVCQASGFYPAPVNFSWTRDGVSISWSSVSQAYPQSDGTFSQFSTLQLLPQDGQVYSCSLEHPALKGERRTRLWTVEFQRPSLAPSIFCAVGLTLGLVGVAVGTFFLVKGNQCR